MRKRKRTTLAEMRRQRDHAMWYFKRMMSMEYHRISDAYEMDVQRVLLAVRREQKRIDVRERLVREAKQ